MLHGDEDTRRQHDPAGILTQGREHGRRPSQRWLHDCSLGCRCGIGRPIGRRGFRNLQFAKGDRLLDAEVQMQAEADQHDAQYKRYSPAVIHEGFG
jgi:hypothetical protein